MDPSGLMDSQLRIPIICITDSRYYPNSEAKAIVWWWLDDVGFFNEYSHWDVNTVTVDGNDFVINLYCEDDSLEPEIDYSIYEVAGYPVVAFNDIMRLDSHDRTLNMLIKLSFQEMNQRSRLLGLTGAGLIDVLFGGRQTPFAGATGRGRWYYMGETYAGADMNYILMGHGMAHEHVPYVIAEIDLRAWELIHGHLVASSSVLFWFRKGYDEYETRADW